MVSTQSPLVPNCSGSSSSMPIFVIASGFEPTLRILTSGEHSPAAVQDTVWGLILARARAEPSPPPASPPPPPPAGAALECDGAAGSDLDQGTVCWSAA